MVTELIKLVFEQAKNEIPNITKTGLSKHISKKIEENDNSKIFSYKTFTRYYDKYISDKEGIIDNPQAEIIEELCRYIGYADYQDFVAKNKRKKNNQLFINHKNELIDPERKVFNREIIAKKQDNTFVLSKFLISLTIFIVVLMSYFNVNLNQVGDDFSLKERGEKIEHSEFINKKEIFKKTRSTAVDTNFLLIDDKIFVLAH